VAAVPVAAASGAATASAVRTAGKPMAAARPVPLAPVVPPAAPPTPAREEGGAAYKRRGSRQKSQVLVGGLTAAMLLLIVIAVVVMNRSPGKKASEKPGRATASAQGTGSEPSSNPEVDPTTAVIPSASEPGTIADPPLAASAAPAEPAAKAKPNPLPAVGKWLDATRTRAGGLRDIVAIGVAKAWLDKVGGGPAVLNVEMQVTNRSLDEPLEFTGWRPDNQPKPELQAMIADEAGNVLRAAPVRPASGRRAARRRIHPDESATEQLSFEFPDGESKYFRLALPYAALGQTGYLGFELPRQMIQEGDPDAKEKVRPEPAETEPETVLPAGAAVKPRPGEPETGGDLRSEIDRGGDAKTDAMKEPPKPAAAEPPMPAEEPQKEPEKIPDIRKLIEEEDRKPEAKDKEPPDGMMQEEPKSP
jgi:hypothetical protein